MTNNDSIFTGEANQIHWDKNEVPENNKVVKTGTLKIAYQEYKFTLKMTKTGWDKLDTDKEKLLKLISQVYSNLETSQLEKAVGKRFETTTENLFSQEGKAEKFSPSNQSRTWKVIDISDGKEEEINLNDNKVISSLVQYIDKQFYKIVKNDTEANRGQKAAANTPNKTDSPNKEKGDGVTIKIDQIQKNTFSNSSANAVKKEKVPVVDSPLLGNREFVEKKDEKTKAKFLNIWKKTLNKLLEWFSKLRETISNLVNRRGQK